MGAYGSPDTFPYDKVDRKCPKCGKIVSGKYCPECGAKLTNIKNKSADQPVNGKVIDITLLCIGFVIGAIGGFGNGKFTAYGFVSMLLFADLVFFLGSVVKAIVFAISRTKTKGSGIKILISFIIAFVLLFLLGRVQ